MENVSYIKLAPYLASYWRHEMGQKKNEPLILPVMEQKLYLYPFLKENADVKRNPSKNKKGYFKDANSYSKYAYDYAMHGCTDIKPKGDKIPTVSECRKLQAIVLPKYIYVDAKKVFTNEFFEIRDDGVSQIREYIRDCFYSELHAHVVGRQRSAEKHNRIPNTKLYINTWLYGRDIIDDEIIAENPGIEKNIRIMLYKYDEKNYSSCDPDSIRRTYYDEIKKKHLSGFVDERHKKNTNKS